jgi:CDP-glycerol glycerophosphotransferase (TagB/SpsB family)
MVLSYYLLKPLYEWLWYRQRGRGKLIDWAVYCADPLDYETMAPVFEHLPPVVVIARNSLVHRYVQKKGAAVQRWPAFARVVLMCRHATHRFPAREIVKVGFRHGPYHFKRFADPAYYNAFDLFFMTSRQEVAAATAAGIRCAVSGGYPKLDPCLNGEYSSAYLKPILASTRHDAAKKTILFTATWDRSGMSALAFWIHQLEQLSRGYNVWVTVHPWVREKFRRKLRSIRGIHFVEEPNAIPYIYLSDVIIGDTSSILAEACALNKPMITFRLKPSSRTNPEIDRMLEAISLRIDSSYELEGAIDTCLQNPELHERERFTASERMFDFLDGSASERCAAAIQDFLESHRNSVRA